MGWKSHLHELALIIGAYLVYLLTRELVFLDSQSKGLANAHQVISLEKSLGFFWEPGWQERIIAHTSAVVVFLNWAYILTYWPIVLTTGLILYVARRQSYIYYRNMMLVSLALALLIFILFPVAPPRLVSEYFVDTIQVLGPSFYGGPEMSPFYNVHAAMPSLHFGWTLLFGVIFLRLLNTWLKILGLIYPVMTFFAITITGNHYILDAVGGAVLAVVSFTILELGARRRLSLLGWGSRFRLPLSNSRRSPEV